MTIRHLKIFVAVCDCGGVTAAAGQLYLAQPAVSLAIAELERHYGVRLFDRISRKLFLTEAGREFLSYARHITALFDQMETAMQNRDVTGKLHLGSSISFGTRLLPQLLRSFYQAFPQIQVTVQVENSEAVERMVLQNQLDFAVIESGPTSPLLTVEAILDDRLVLLCGWEHPLSNRSSISLPELENLPLLLRERGSGTRDLFDSVLLTHGMTVSPSWESSSVEALIGAAKMGLGVAVLPQRMVEEQFHTGGLHPIQVEGVDFLRHYYLIWHKNKYLSPAAQDFIEHTRKVISSF